MRLPVLLIDGRDLIVFASAHDAATFVEPPDVDEGIAYDATGRVVKFQTDGRRTTLVETEVSQPNELRAALLDVFAATDTPVSQGASLDELVAEASRRFVHSPRR